MSGSPNFVTKALAVMSVASALLLPASAAVAQTPDRKPMAIEDVRRLVEQGVRSQTILAALQQNCLAVYGVNEEMERELSAAGADSELVEGLARVCWGAPGGPVMDPTQPFVMLVRPAEWSANDPEIMAVEFGSSLRIEGLAHAPSGVDRLEIDGTAAALSSADGGGVRFSATVKVRPGLETLDLVLHPREGESYRKMLPLRIVGSLKDDRAWETTSSQQTADAYANYLDRFPNGAHAEQARERMADIDREAYQRAVRAGSRTALDRYLEKYPDGDYRTQAEEALRDRDDDEAIESARKTNTLTAYQNYLRQFPEGRHAAEAHAYISTAYHTTGKLALQRGEYSVAVEAYEAYLIDYLTGPHREEAEENLATARRKLRIAQLPDRSLIAWHTAPATRLGVMFAGLRNETGGLFAIRANPGMLKLADQPSYTVNNDGTFSGQASRALTPTGEENSAEIEAVVGLTKSVYPDIVWAYAGGGGGYYTAFSEFEPSSGGTISDELVWVRKADQSRFGWVAEGGVMVNLGGFAFTGGYATRQLEEGFFTFSIGFGLLAAP